MTTERYNKMATYARVRRLVTPSRMTGRYLFLTSILLAFPAYGALRLAAYSTLLAAICAVTIPLTAAVDLSILGRDEWKHQHSVLAFELDRIAGIAGTLLLIVGLTFVVVEPQQTFTSYKLLPVGAAAVFWVPVWWLLALKYQSSYNYYVNEYSQHFDMWEAAAVSMDRGRTAKSSESYYNAFYHYREAERWYKALKKVAERDEYRAAATGYQRAAESLKYSMAAGNQTQAKRHFEQANEYINEVNEVLRYRACDDCGEKHSVSDVYRTTTPNGFEESIYCEECFHSVGSEYDIGDKKQTRRNRQRTTQTNSTSSTQQSSSRSAQTSSNSKTTKQHNRSQRRREDERAVDDQRTHQSQKAPREYEDDETVTVEWACDVLDVEQPFDDDEVTEAFRAQAKEAHPDAGGSPEDFKKIKQARDRLERHLDA